MENAYTTVLLGAEGFYEEKKSRFLSYVFEVKDEQEIEAYLVSVRKQHYSATHHCYAYVLGKDGAVSKCSDDGEPQKTAGYPILSVIQGQSLVNILVIVVRYFGGTLLGTGGLVRAYTNAAKDGIEKSVLIRKTPADLLSVTCDYNAVGKLQYFFAAQGYRPLSSDYGADMRFSIPIERSETKQFTEKVTDLTQGKVKIEKVQEVWCGEVNGQMYTFSD